MKKNHFPKYDITNLDIQQAHDRWNNFTQNDADGCIVIIIDGEDAVEFFFPEDLHFEEGRDLAFQKYLTMPKSGAPVDVFVCGRCYAPGCPEYGHKVNGGHQNVPVMTTIFSGYGA